MYLSSSIYNNIIYTLAHAWGEPDIRSAVKDHLIVFKPDVSSSFALSFFFHFIIIHPTSLPLCSFHPHPLKVFPSLYDWVSYPITILTKKIYRLQMDLIEEDRKPCPFHLELLASLERLLCFCHTGSAKVFATSLMNPLGLSRGAVSDGFPMLHNIFIQPSILSAMNFRLVVDPAKWPIYNGYPAIASKKAQIFSYSLSHFMVSFLI